MQLQCALCPSCSEAKIRMYMYLYIPRDSTEKQIILSTLIAAYLMSTAPVTTKYTS